ncbi:hypothetical protein [Moritella marina]|uniref:hypothetical protein n=1 Tax=Moritella marina TaxID=90736 RepID=UPI0003768BAF|nr:hypothetical protein [Moritella marina]
MYTTFCTIIRIDGGLKKRVTGLEMLIKAQECLNSLSAYLTDFSKVRTHDLVKRSVNTWSQNKTPLKYNLKYTAYVDWIPKESKVPLFPILIGCSVIASKSVSKIYVLPLLN